MAELKNLEKIHPELKNLVGPYCQNILKLHQDRVISILVYGSAAGRHYIPKKSNINLLIVFEDIPFSVLKSSLKATASGRKKRILAPLFLTKEHILSSSDVFPIEFFDIKENHVTLYGEDFFQNLPINQSNLRLQCEQEIKGKLIRLRQSYLEVGLKKKYLEDLMVQSLTSLLPVFRNIIRLGGSHPAQFTRDHLIREVAQSLHLPEEIFFTILNIKEGNLRPGQAQLERIIESYLGTLHELALKIDHLTIFPEP